MDKLRCKVIMLPTEKASRIHTIPTHPDEGDHVFIHDGTYDLGTKPQHLYLVSEREIEQDNYIYYYNEKLPLFNGVHRVLSIRMVEGKKKCVIKNGWEILTDLVSKVEVSTDESLGLPLIPESFIQEYVDSNGKIEEVDIMLLPIDDADIVRVKKDRTVVIFKVEERMFTLEEMKKAWLDGTISLEHGGYDTFEQFIENYLKDK